MPMNDDFSRVFDRSIAYLYRRRKRYLGEHLRPYGLSGGMHNFITYLHRFPGQSQDALCSRFYVEKCTVSKRVKQMETMGYIRREVDGFSVSEEDMPTGLGKRLLSAILEGEDGGGFGFEMLNESFTQDEVSRAEKMRVDRMKLSDNGPDVFDGTLRALREENEKNRNKDDGDFLYFIRKKRGEASPDQQ